MKVTIQDTRTSVTVRPRDFKVTVSGARGPQGPPGEAGASEWGDIGGTLSNQTDLQTALDAKVPYTGATQDMNLGEYGAQLGNLEFDNTPTNVPTTAGSVYWNDTDGTLNIVLKGGQTISRVGETQHIRALNNTGAQIARGKVVYVVGAQGQRLTIALADADTEILSKDTIGFTAEAIADGAEGFVIVQGVINNVSTTGMTDGATVYLSQTAGSYTTTPPADPAHLVILGFIVNGGSGGAGSIYVKVDNGYELEELHNVSNSAKTTPVGDDALFLRDSADNNLWKRLTWTNALAGGKSHMDTFKSVAGGYASLDGSGKVPASELPSYVDDVVEVANYAALPGTGETGKIYVTLDTNKCYRWSGSVYVEVSQGIDTLTTIGTSGAATLVGSTLNIPQYQGVLTNPVTGTGTAGQVAYFSGTSAVTGSSLLVWDNATRQLKIAGASGNYTLDLTTTSNSTSIRFEENSVLKSFIQHIGSTFATVNRREFLEISGTNGIAFRTSGEVGRFNGTNFLLNSTNDNGQRLQVYGSTLLRGSGTTSATTALLVQNSTPTNLFQITDNGVATLTPTTLTGSEATSALDISQTWNTTGTPTLIKANVTNTASGASSLLLNLQVGSVSRFRITHDSRVLLNNGAVTGFYPISGDVISTNVNAGIRFDSAVLDVAGSDFLFTNGNGNNTITSGTANFLKLIRSFTPTSGSGVHNTLLLQQTINQTGGANGITRGLYVNPTLTSAADWRSVEFSNNTGWGLYGAGTANNYLGGSLGIGTTSLTGRKLAISGNTVGSGFNFGILLIPTIQNDVTNYLGFNSEPSTQSTSFTLTTLRHFSAIQGTFGLGSSVTTQVGFWANSSLTGATNNYGFYGDIASGTGRWNLYMNGTADNYLAGGLGIGSTSLSGHNLRISKILTGAVTSHGLLIDSVIQTDVTSVGRYFATATATVAGSSLILIEHYRASQGVYSGSVSIQYGFHAQSSLTGATNNYGFYGDIASGTGRWNLYMNGTAANYLAGNTSIGTTTSSGRLTVRGSGTTSATNGLLVEDSTGTDNFTIRDDGGYAFRGGTVGLAQTGYTTFTNLTTDRTCDANATTVEELADILGTLIEDLKTKGIIAA